MYPFIKCCVFHEKLVLFATLMHAAADFAYSMGTLFEVKRIPRYAKHFVV